MPLEIRRATEADLPQIQTIFEYYVLNTVVSFLINKPPPGYVRSRYEESKKRKLPYLVAAEKSSGQVLGYTYASAFRGFMLGYGHSVEMTIFCHPDHTSRGIGNQLIEAILEALRTTKHVSWEASYEDDPVEFDVRRVFAVMAVDETAPRAGLALRDWYLKWGFEEVGRLKEVGCKQGRTIDTMYLERAL